MDSNDFTTTDEFTDDSSISSTATFNFTINSTPTINSTINSTATINSTINSTITFNNESTTAFNPIENLYDHTPLFVFIFGSFGVGAILRILLRKWAVLVNDWKCGSVLKVPYTVFLMLIGIALAEIGMVAPEIRPYLLSDISPELFLHIFLPVVIFESAYVIDTHVFWRSLGLISLLSVPGLLVSTVLTACLALLIPEIQLISNLSARIFTSLLFGAMLSATDPVAVVALLKELGCQKYMSVVIEGESLLNDGVATVVFRICIVLLQSMSPFYEEFTELALAGLIIQQITVGPIIGWLAAMFEGFILQQIYNDALAEITITLSFTYLTFYVGEACRSSGVMAVVVLGIALDRTSITPEVNHFLHRFWEMLAYLANTLIFVIVGVLITQHLNEYTPTEFGRLLLLYVGVLIARAVSVIAFYPTIRKQGLDLTWKHVVVMIWSGLRGAVGLALAVYLTSFAENFRGEREEEITTTIHPTFSIQERQIEKNEFDDIEFEVVFNKILRHTAGIVLLTLVINASTVEAVLKKLGMLEVTSAQQVTMLNAVQRIRGLVRVMINVLKYDRFLADAKWSTVEEMTFIEYPYKSLPQRKSKLTDVTGLLVHFSPNDTTSLHISDSEDWTFQDLFEESRIRMIKALKMSFAKQYGRGLLNDQEARVLINAADKAVYKPKECIDMEHIEKTWKIGTTLPRMKRILESWFYGAKQAEPVLPDNKCRRWVGLMVTSNWFEILMQLIILLNTIPISLDFAINETWQNREQWYYALEVINIVFVSIYALEIILKIVGLGFKELRYNYWTQFDFAILMASVIEIIIDETVIGNGNDDSAEIRNIQYSRVAKLLRILRALRLLRLSKAILPKSIDFINKQINKRLSFGYNVAKGFVTAEEEVNKLIETICQNRKIQTMLMEMFEEKRLHILKAMGLLQRDHPGTVVSVKTKNAIRTLLNISKDAIVHLCSGGVLDETEIKILERGIEVKLKRLAHFPAHIAACEPEDVIEDLVWIKDDADLLLFMKQRGVWKEFQQGDVITSETGPFYGIHLIIRGIVKTYNSRLESSLQHVTKQIASKSEARFVENNEEHSQQDILGPGRVIGDLALLTNREKKSTVTCESSVETYFVSMEDMQVAFSIFPGLRLKMWKVAAIPVATHIYLQNYEFQDFTSDLIQHRISEGYIVELTEACPIFNFTEAVLEALLIHGAVLTKFTMEILEAPCLLTSDLEEVELYWSHSAVLLVIPRDRKMSCKMQGTVGGRKTRSRSGRNSIVLTPELSKKIQAFSPKPAKVWPAQPSVIIEDDDETDAM